MSQRASLLGGSRTLAPLHAFQQALVLHDQGRLWEATQFYEVVLKADGRHFGAAYRFGLVRLQQGKFADAERLFRLAAKIDKASADAQFHLAAALSGLGRPEEAIRHYERALYIKPRFAEAHNNVGYALQQLGRHEEAISHYEKALSINPAYAEARNNLGSALSMLGLCEEALTQFHKALAIKPSYAEAHNNLGNVLGTLGRGEEAIAHYRKAIASRPNYADPHHSLGNALHAIGRPEEAVEHYQKALAIDSSRPAAHNGLGDALQALGRHEEAIAAWRRAIALHPDDAEACAHLGNALGAIGRHEEARGSHERAVSINNVRAAQALDTAIAAIQARQAGDIRYGRRGGSAGCLVAHPGLGERWLKVSWAPASEINQFFWDGELLSAGIENIPRPQIFEHFDWETEGHCHRAILMSVAPGAISRQPYPEATPALEPAWWRELSNALASLQATQTDRIYVTEEDLANRLQERFGLRLKQHFTCWQTSHGDLQWANLTSPRLSILDWESWGRAPYGFDIARLHVFSVASPEIVAMLKKEFATVIAHPEYDIAFLFAASGPMQIFELFGGASAIQTDLRTEVEIVLDKRRFSPFCE